MKVSSLYLLVLGRRWR